MRCPKCGAELPEGSLYCEKCGEDIHIVPDYDPSTELLIKPELDVKEKPIPRKQHTEMVSVPPKSNDRIRLRWLKGGLALLAVLTIAMIIITMVSVRRFNSYAYQISQGAKHQSLGEYAKAAECYARAMELDGESVELLEKMANLYFLQNDQFHFENTLRSILNHPDSSKAQRRDAVERLVPLLIKKGDFHGVSTLVLESDEEDFMEAYHAYLSPRPELELPEGSYVGMQSLRITSDGEGTIYYTTDGTVPNENSIPYTLPIVLDFGNNTIKVCLINAYGVKSEVVTGEYVIEYPKESAPNP